MSKKISKRWITPIIAVNCMILLSNNAPAIEDEKEEIGSVLLQVKTQETTGSAPKALPKQDDEDQPGGNKEVQDLFTPINTKDTPYVTIRTDRELYQWVKEHPDIRGIKINGAQKITSLAPIAKLKGLIVLHISGCPNLRNIGAITQLKNLQELQIIGATSLTGLEPIARLQELEALTLNGTPANDIGFLSPLKKLRAIDLSGSHYLAELNPLGELPELQALVVDGCMALEDIRPLYSLNNLTHFSHENCARIAKEALNELHSHIPGLGKSLEDLPDELLVDIFSNYPEAARASLGVNKHLTGVAVGKGLPGHKLLRDKEELDRYLQIACKVREVEVGFDIEDKELSALVASNPGMTHLHLDECTGLKDGSMLCNLPELKNLHLEMCSALAKLDFLCKLKALEVLNISGCSDLTTLSYLAPMDTLEELHLSDCWELSDTKALDKFPKLSVLTLRNCDGLERLSNLCSRSGTLTCLKISGCRGLKDLDDLNRLDCLEVLELSDCGTLNISKLLSKVSSCKSLTTLSILNCGRGMGNLRYLKGLSNLRRLTLHGCGDLQSLSSLSSLGDLEVLKIDEHDKLKGDIENLQSALPNLRVECGSEVYEPKNQINEKKN